MATRTGVVVAGGLVAGDASTAHAYRLDLRSGRAKRLPDLAVPVHDVGSAVARGVAEVVGGGNATEQDVIQTAGADGIWRISAHLPERRSDLVAVTVGDHTFVVGGYDGVSMALASVQTSWKGGPFHAFARLRLPVRYPAVAVAAGAIWVFGGERGGQEVDAIQRIDLHSGRVRIAGHLLGPLGHASAVRFGSRILLVGGRTGQSVPSAAMWWFDPARRSLRPAGALPTPLADSAVVRAGTAAYLVGGETPALSDRVLRLRVVPGP